MRQLTIRSHLTSVELVRPEPGERIAAPAPTPASTARTRYETLMRVRHIVNARRSRSIHLNAKLFADPAWDILLELFAASLAQRKLTVSRVCERAGVPGTTALRWIQVVVEEGLAERYRDPLDRRQVFIVLSDEGERAMETYFERLPAF